MLKYVAMAALVAGSMSMAPQAFALNGSTFFANQPKGCHMVKSDLKVVDAIWVGCKFKWWGAKFVPGAGFGGNGVVNSSSSEDPCEPPPCIRPPCERTLGFRSFFHRPT
jgi:hypothetical protein